MGKIVPECVLWPETDMIAPLVREKAIDEAIDAWDEWQESQEHQPLWGDEIEYALFALNSDAKTANHCLRAPELLKKLQMTTAAGTYSPEIAKFQIESQPPVPYIDSVESLLSVEQDMADRRATIKKHLAANEFPLTISIHPRFGCTADTQASLTTTTALTAPVQRYLTAQHNITARRRPGPTLHIPLFQDTNTFNNNNNTTTTLPAFIDPGDDADGPSITFAGDEALVAISQCCLQATFQARDAPAARRLHDALVPLAPVLLALTAATPVFRGWLAGTDARWNAIVAMSDDRNAEERTGEGAVRPRYWCAEAYVAREAPEACQPGGDGGGGLAERLRCPGRGRGRGMDAGLARYYARVLARPLLIYPVECARALLAPLRRDSGAVDGVDGGGEVSPPPPPAMRCAQTNGRGNGGDDDDGHCPRRRREGRDGHENFECLTGAAYPSVKLKHPSPDDPALGWRVEFRSMENSVTDFENAAFVVFVALVRRAIERRGGVDWYVPMEQVWENMERAHARDAVRWQRFWWAGEDGSGESTLLTVDEIVNGCGSFKGLMGLVEEYMTDEGFGAAEREKLQPYLDLVSGRASGRLCTTARFMRDFVTRHPEYARDSQVSEKICFDLVQEVVEITNGKRDCGLFQSS